MKAKLTFGARLSRVLTATRSREVPRNRHVTGVSKPCRGTRKAGTAGQRGLIGSRLYDTTTDENRAYFRKPRLSFVVLVALDNGDPVIVVIDGKLGSLGECFVERRCDIIGPYDPHSVFGLAEGADRRE